MFALALLGLAAAGSPVARVVTLLGDLKGKIVADGQAEQALYDKYACWCEETTARKAAAIEEGKALLEQLSKDILELGAAGGVSTATLARLNKDIAANIESTKAAESLRSNEHAEYTARKGELEKNVANVKIAIQTLSKGTTGFTPAMVETQTLTIAAGVRSALKQYQRVAPKAQDMATVERFLRDPSAWMEVKAAPHLQQYTTQSTAIQGILAEMKDTFERELADSKVEETQTKSDYDDLMDTKSSELKQLKAQLTRRTSQSGDDTKSLADDTVEREETETALRADEEFFVSMKQGCKDRADQWAARSHIRTEELGQISKATEILSDGMGALDKSASVSLVQGWPTFVQLGRPAAASRGPRDWAFSALKKAAKHGRVQLAYLATEVYEQTGAGGHFDAVLGEIDGMIEVLRKEERSDIEHKDFCQSERSAADSKKERLGYDMTELENKATRLQNQINARAAEITKTETAINELNETMIEATENRADAHAEFVQADRDDRNATALVQQALDTLGAFYGKAALVAAKSSVNKADPIPAPDVVKDSAPDMGYDSSEEYGGRQSEGGGIVMILEMIHEDIVKEIASQLADEDKAQKAFEELRTDSVNSLNAMAAKKAELQQMSADLTSTKANTDNVHLDKEGTSNATQDYLDDIEPDCDWIMAQFTTRAEQRKDELAGLGNAKSILNGAGWDASSDAPTEGGVNLELPAQGAAVRRASGAPHKETVEDELADLDADEKRGFGFLQRR